MYKGNGRKYKNPPLNVTVEEFLQYFIDENIPPHAEIYYLGCGSHEIEVSWDEE